MKVVKVLGSGCANCKALAKQTQIAADNCGVDVEIVKVEDFTEIAKWNVMATPALVVDEELKSSGRVLKAKEIEPFLQEEND